MSNDQVTGYIYRIEYTYRPMYKGCEEGVVIEYFRLSSEVLTTYCNPYIFNFVYTI